MNSATKTRWVLDASALLVYLRQERGREKVLLALNEGAVASSVNLAEVLANSAAKGASVSSAMLDRLRASMCTTWSRRNCRTCITVCPSAFSAGIAARERGR